MYYELALFGPGEFVDEMIVVFHRQPCIGRFILVGKRGLRSKAQMGIFPTKLRRTKIGFHKNYQNKRDT